MEHLPDLISDLALILIAAGVVTLLFKRLRQPLVLGYIVAGFLAGPHMPYTPSVDDTSSVSTWANIGVIFLMFTLGLEFSFKKIVKMGIGPIIAACSVMFCMISVGSGVGHLFGWSSMDSLFLGGMLAMSSTTIIYKAFDDLGLRQKKFAGEVLSVLILEDILGILLMVVLSALAVSRNFQGTELIGSFLKLGFFLILWFLVGVYLVPQFLKRNNKWMNRETLLVVSVGMCFALVVMAAHAGYSAAFGAFMMGSILAETVEAESIERLVGPVKDLFGAIFFVSVGMLVNPQILAEYWLPVCVITLAILLGQVLFGTGSFLLSGQPLQVAMRCGFSLAQIGEFAFIIASLGLTLNVTSDFLYPVVVAVSIITTFLTPYMIRAAVPAYAFVERIMPRSMRHALTERGGHRHQVRESSLWKSLGTALIGQVGAYVTLSIAVIGISFAALLPFSRATFGHWPGNAVCGILTLLTASPFLRAIVMRKNHSEEFRQLWNKGRWNRLGLRLTLIVRFLIATAAVCYVLDFLSPFHWAIHCVVAMFLTGLMILSRRIKLISIRMERTFLQNLRSREVRDRAAGKHGPAYAGRLQRRDVHIARLEIPDNSLWGGQTLRQLDFSRRDGVMIAAILRGSVRLNIPDGNTQLFPGDRIEIIGDDAGLEAFSRRMETDVYEAVTADSARKLLLRRVILGGNSPFIEKTLGESGIRETFQCMVVGFEETDGTLSIAAADRPIVAGDTLWLVGEEESLRRLSEARNGPEVSES